MRVSFFTATSTPECYTLSLHDALPICTVHSCASFPMAGTDPVVRRIHSASPGVALVDIPSDKDRKSTRLNSSHLGISYAVFCLKKKKQLRVVDLVDETKAWKMTRLNIA